MGRTYKVVDTVILILCLPFYAVAIPLMYAHDWLLQKRGVRLGQKVTHWPMRDAREDYLVSDLSRLDEGLVGIRRRRWSLRGGNEAPPFSDTIEYIPRQRFWVPRPFSLRDRRIESSQRGGQRGERSDSEGPR